MIGELPIRTSACMIPRSSVVCRMISVAPKAALRNSMASDAPW
jgi:hypothetical protein